MKFPLDTFWNPRWLKRARRSKVACFGFAFLCTIAACIAWQVMAAPLADETPYQVLLPFIVLVAWFGGTLPALLTTVLCTVWAVTHGMKEMATLAQQLELLLFLPIGAFVAALCGSLNRARDEAEDVAQQLSVSQQHYQSIVETASEGIWTTDAQLYTTFANARMAQILGTTPEAMVGRPVWDFLFEEDRAIPLQSLETGLLEKPHEAERRYQSSDGAEVWCQVNASPIRDHAGKIIGVLALHTDITQRRQQSAALQESHERFELATRAIAGFIYAYEVQNDSIYRSAGFVDVTGYNATDSPTTLDWWRAQLHPQDRAAFEANIEASEANVEASQQGGEQFSIEYRARHADGGYRWLWDRSLVMRGDKGEVKRIIGSVSDISPRKSMEVALRESEANFRQLADSMPQIVWTSNARGVPDYFNRRWYEYSGQPQGLIGQGSWEEFFHPDDREEFAWCWNNCRSGETPFLAEVRLRDQEGVYRWFLCRASPVKEAESGELVRWFGTATDIDVQRRAANDQQFLAEVGVLLNASLDPEITLEQVTRLAVPHLGDWCFVALKNADGNPEMVAAAHRNAEKIADFWKRHHKYGLSADATRGLPAVIRTGVPELVEEVDESLWSAAFPQVEYQQEVLKAGHRSTLIVPLEVRGEILGAIGFTYAERDRYYSATDLPLAQELARRAAIAIENARLYRQLQDADRRKDEFLAMLAHELRNPLAAISGARALLDDILEGDAKTMTGTPRAILERQTSHLARLVDDLMDVSRITRGKIELRRQTVDFAEMVRNSVESVRPLIVSRRHDLRIELPPKAVLIDADPARLGQIISNLVTNAAKYTDPGGQIFVSLSLENREGILKVRDTGTGLRLDMINNIWGLFVQSDRTLDRSQGGLGIGLTLVKSLAEMHGGRVGAHSEGLGKGSEFLVAIPLLNPIVNESAPARQDKTEDAPVESVEVAALTINGSQKLGNMVNRVLVVDDNQDAALMLCTWLESRGYDVQVAHDGAEGLVLACGWKPDVALLDIGMPELDGYEFARRLRVLPEGREMRLIAVTGYGQPSDHARALEAGFDFHLVKPVDVDELRKIIEG